MSILSAIKETQHESNNLDDLAKLPQALIMNMAQRGEIKQDMLMPILGRKAEMAEETAKRKAAEQLAAQGGVQPTVMEQYMGKIAQAENPAPPMPQQQMPQQMAQAPMPQGPEDVGIATQPTQPMQLAGGGIIAFDDGGDVEGSDEEDYQEALDDAREEAMNSKLYEMVAGLKGSRESDGFGIASGYRGAERGMDGDLESRLRAQIMSKESGGRRYDKQGNLLTSSKGAQGEMQVMPGTARDPGFGIKAARNNSPDELRRVGDEYASVLLNRYGDPKLAMIAYNMGPGATDKWLAAGADMRKLPKETQGYIRNVSLAQGGEVRHFANEGYVDPNDRSAFQQDLIDWFGYSKAKDERPEVPEWLQASKEYFTKPRKPAAKDEKGLEKIIASNTTAPVPLAQPKGNAPQITQNPEGIKNLQAKADEENFNLMQYIKGREAKMDAAEKKDLAMAGLAAGLGMLESDSPYWNVGIGRGGQKGVQQLASSQKTRAAQEAALGKLYGSAAQTDLMNKLRRDQLAQGKELKEDQMAQNLLTAKNTFIKDRLKALGMDEMILGTLRRQKAMGKLDPAKESELNYYEDRIRNVEREADRMYSSPGAGMRIVGVR